MHQARRSIPQPLRAATYETLIGLLAATGLRVGEAIRLDRRDIDWDEGVLLVRRSKFGKSRVVPLRSSTLEALNECARRRDRLCPHPASASFFVSLRATRVIYDVCGRLTGCSASVPASAPGRPIPRGCTHALLRRADAGGLVSRRPRHPRQAAWLATYLGHREPRYTYHYLSAAPELLEHAARLLEHAQAVRP
jgi:integrase/recombinase XerD